MPSDTTYDLIIRNVRIVRPEHTVVELGDIGITGEKITGIGAGLAAQTARQAIDGNGLLAFPGLVDAHMHTGIYSPLTEDALSESRAAAQGGVTTSLNYIRSGQYYLNKGGPYAELFPEILGLSEGRFYVDYGFHLAPMNRQQIGEIPMLIDRYGVTSFKIFMFYGGYGLHGASRDQHEFLMIDAGERYDLAHFEFVMRGVKDAMQRCPAAKDAISLSLHCETAEIMTAYTRLVQEEGKLRGLRAYSAARPPHSEGLAICIASYLAYETECININLLHLSSRKAVEAALKMAAAFPQVNFRREVTVGHLVLDYDSPADVRAKVNPPVRSREDVEFLWDAVLTGKVDWVVSDHACCRHELKIGATGADDIFLAKSGFGGTEWLLSAMLTEGRKRGLALHRIAELTSHQPARRFGLQCKGDLALGYDADIVLVDPDRSFTVTAAESESAQGYTPFEGLQMRGKVQSTYLRGQLIYHDDKIVGGPRGRYLKRPC